MASLLALSYELVNQGKYAEACANFDVIIIACPELASAYIGRGTARAMQRQIHAAVDDFTEAIRLQPNFIEGYKRRGQARAAIGQEAAGVEDLNAAIAIASKTNASTVDLIMQRGLLKQKMGDLPGAKEDLMVGLDNNGTDPVLWNQKGLCEASMGCTAGAVECYQTCIGMHPTFKETYVNLAQAYKEAGEFDASKLNFDKALSMDSSYIQAYHLRGLLYHARGEHTQACEDFERVRRLDPSAATLEACFMIGVCRQALGACHEAVEVYATVMAQGLGSDLHSMISHMAFYQREMCLFCLGTADAPLSGLCLDDALPAELKEGWCKKAPPQLVLMKGYRARPASDTASVKDLNAAAPADDRLGALTDAVMRLGGVLQYQCPGFHANARQHRMGGFATLECAQLIRLGAPPRWKETFEVAVRWRQLSEPLDAVFWVNKLPPEEFAAGFGSHTPLVTGWNQVIRYYPQFPRAFSLLKQIIAESRAVNDACNRVIVPDDGQLERVRAAETHDELYDVFGCDFWVVTPCRSVSRPGHVLDGTRITVQRLSPRHRGHEFSIRTPCTPARWDDFEAEMTAAWKDCVGQVRLLRERLQETAGGESEFFATYAQQRADDLPAHLDLVPRIHRLIKAALRVSFYWYNFMPLSRGSASLGLIMLHALLLSAGFEIRDTLPDGQQIDWEAITTPAFDEFAANIARSWLHRSVHVVHTDVLKHVDEESVTSVVPTIRALFHALSYRV
mmetsp:Transcript_120516/g.341538  ORF Transcript_120516/g.341538 Transcript_120516/m.341538 type:complete len:735 (-) Transcript_120516:101-2305(-)